jgi:hypothetical protein
VQGFKLKPFTSNFQKRKKQANSENRPTWKTSQLRKQANLENKPTQKTGQPGKQAKKPNNLIKYLENKHLRGPPQLKKKK